MLPLLPYFMAYLGGLLAAFPASREFLLPYLLPATAWALAVAMLWPERRRFPWLALMVLAGIGCVLPGAWKTPPDDHVLRRFQEGERADVIGVLTGAPERFDNRVRLELDLESVAYGGEVRPVRGRARITVYEPEALLAWGDRVQVLRVRLKRPRNFKNPGRFDFEHYMRTQGIDVMGGVSRAERVERLGHVPPAFWERWLGDARAGAFRQIDARMGGPAAAVLKAMVLGEKQFLDEGLRRAYTDTGLIHLMAVSGLHIGFVAGASGLLLYHVLFSLALRFWPAAARSGRVRRWAAVLCLPPVLAYMALVGARVSALRAGLMVLVYLLAVLAGRAKDLPNALLVAAFLILLASPNALLSPGFLLSFTALIGITFALRCAYWQPPVDRASLDAVLWYQRLPFLRQNPEYRLSPVLEVLAGTALISLPAILATLPVSIFFFNQVGFASFILNLVMIPLASVVVPLTLLALLLGAVAEPLGAALFYPLDFLTRALMWIPLQAQRAADLALYQPQPPQFWPILYYAALFGVPWLLTQRRRRAAGLSSSAGARHRAVPWALGTAALGAGLWLLWPRFPVLNDGRLHIYLLDVGQGEALFLETPDHRTLLIDGGGFFGDSLDVGRAVVAPFLWQRGLRAVDYLMVSHSDQDHIAGVESLAEFFPIRHFLTRSPPISDERLDRLRDRLRRGGTELRPLESGEELQLGPVSIRNLHPSPQFVADQRPGQRVRNNLSRVIRIQYGEFSLLFTGDITEDAERHLLAGGVDVSATLLKLAHHGSRFSSAPEFLDAVRPGGALVSSGRFNSFGHPHPEVLERLRERGIALWRTDQNGAIHVVTDGRGYKIETHENL